MFIFSDTYASKEFSIASLKKSPYPKLHGCGVFASFGSTTIFTLRAMTGQIKYK